MTEEIHGIRVEIGPWEPPKRVESALQRYLDRWERKVRAVSQDPDTDVSTYMEYLQRHVERLNRFQESDESRYQGLGLGEVQAGKTGHMVASACWAADHSIDLCLIFTGTKVALTKQTFSRLEEDLPPGAFDLELVPPSFRTAQEFDAKCSHLRTKVMERARTPGAPLPLLVVGKINRRLDTTLRLVSAISSITKVSALILDDEGDEASADTSASTRNTTRQRRQSRVHQTIVNIRDEVLKKLVYLSYTATPQALFLGDLEGPLQPRFVSIVPAGSSYYGLRSALSVPETLIPIPIPGEPSQPTPQEDVYHALEVALARFLVKVWVHQNYPELFHGEGSASCSMRSLQMLIHPSAQQDPHSQYRNYVENLIAEWRESLESPRSRPQLIQDFLVKAFAHQLGRYTSADLEKANFSTSAVQSFLDFAYLILAEPSRLTVLEVNSEEFQRRARSGNTLSALPSEDSAWNDAEAWILVGGNILGRGITIPHLVTTFFLRDPNQPNFDTATQQMRFCGYRQSYRNSIELFAPQTVIDTYEDIEDIDFPSRNRAVVWDQDSTDLIQNPPVARFALPTSSRLRLTRTNVVSRDVQLVDPGATQSTGFFRTAHVGSSFRLVSNIESLQNVTPSLDRLNMRISTSKGWEVVSFASSSNNVRDLLQSWSVSNEEKTNIGTIADLLHWRSDCGGLADQECVLAVDQPLLGQLAPESLFEQLSAAGQQLFRRACLNIEGWSQSRDFDELREADDRIAIKAVVGQSEREVRDQFPESLVLHARVFSLDEREGSPTLGVGVTLICWVPPQLNIYAVNAAAAGR